MRIVSGHKRIFYQLVDEPFARSEQGSVYAIVNNPNIVAKIFNENYRQTDQYEKLKIMISDKPVGSVINQFTWPMDVISENQSFIGYIMPRLNETKKLNEIISINNRNGLTWTLYLAIAKNLCAAVTAVHEIGYVCGDLNPNNIRVNVQNGTITLDNIDSYHIFDPKTGKTYRCGIGVPEYLPKELQGKNLSVASLPTYTKASDLFALAVLVFSLLMNGYHPFACEVAQETLVWNSVQPADNIGRGRCLFLKDHLGLSAPKYAPSIDILTDKLKELFSQAFIVGNANPRMRPSAEEWYKALTEQELEVTKCSLDYRHQFYRKLSKCPWCAIDQKYQSIRSSASAPKLQTIQQVPYKGTLPVQPAVAPKIVPKMPPRMGPTMAPTYIPPAYIPATAPPQTSQPVTPQKSKAGIIAVAVISAIVLLGIIASAVNNTFSRSNFSTQTTSMVDLSGQITTREMNEFEQTTIEDAQNNGSLLLGSLPSGEADPESFILQLNQRYIDKSELDQYSQEQVAYIRNGIYALSGRIFVKEIYIKYFTSKDWYTPLYDGDESTYQQFNDYQKANLDVCVLYEQEHGWR